MVNNLHYKILLTESIINTYARIRCQCGSIIKINCREGTLLFQLSDFYKPIRDSNYLMMKTKKKESKETNANVNDLLKEIMVEIKGKKNEDFTIYEH